MGEKIEQIRYDPEALAVYEHKLGRCLHALRLMLDGGWFEGARTRVGMELELVLVDEAGNPRPVNDPLLERLESTDFQTELAQFNIEFNLKPCDVSPAVLHDFEETLACCLDHALEQAGPLGAQIVLVGILPTLQAWHLTEHSLSSNPRYHALNEQILLVRGEDLRIDIEGDERLRLRAGSITPEAASTSLQLHLQVTPDEFPRYWNVAQAISAAQLAVACNSPFLLGRQLWRETRIAVFEQAIDTRTQEAIVRGVPPRVWFGDRWVTGVLELFEETVSCFPPLLPVISDEDPIRDLRRGTAPRLKELTLLNGTVWRWNRPVYAVADGVPHLRVENRVLPAGPSVVDAIANAAFYYGLLRHLAEQDPELVTRLDFRTATENFYSAARHGIESELVWPEAGAVPARELVLEHLLPLAHEGLTAWGIDPVDRDRYLGITERRCAGGQTGATWQIDMVRSLMERRGLDRDKALREMTRRYIEHMRANEPVHTWPVD